MGHARDDFPGEPPGAPDLRTGTGAGRSTDTGRSTGTGTGRSTGTGTGTGTGYGTGAGRSTGTATDGSTGREHPDGRDPLSPADFDAMYAEDPDPWDVATSFYERRKIDLVLATLRRPRYGLAWDAGCGTGELAAALAGRAGRVVATDASATAVDLTRARVRGLPVEVEHSALPAAPRAVPAGAADLVVVSEVLYYLTPEQRAASHRRIVAACAPRADVVAVHWGPRPEDALARGVDAQRDLNEHLAAHGFGRLVTHTDIEFVLVLFSRDVPSTIGR